MKLSVVIPVYNEARTIADIIELVDGIAVPERCAVVA
jgi:glycosyltransferase involved in cell wall biosynthesis